MKRENTIKKRQKVEKIVVMNNSLVFILFSKLILICAPLIGQDISTQKFDRTVFTSTLFVDESEGTFDRNKGLVRVSLKLNSVLTNKTKYEVVYEFYKLGVEEELVLNYEEVFYTGDDELAYFFAKEGFNVKSLEFEGWKGFDCFELLVMGAARNNLSWNEIRKVVEIKVGIFEGETMVRWKNH